MSEEVENQKLENEKENKDGEQPKKKKKKKKKKAEATEEKDDKEKEDIKENKDNNDKNENNDENITNLNNEALSNIPSKEVPKKKKKKKKEDKDKDKEDNDKKETKGLDINEILNNNNDNNNGDLMITELLDVNGEKKKKKKKKKKHDKDNENNEENENIKEIINEEKEKEKGPDKKNILLKDKYNSLEVSDSLKAGVNNGIVKSQEDIHEDIKSDKLTINPKVISNKELHNLSKSLENILMKNNNVFLTVVNKYSERENRKNLRFLKNEELILKKNISKLNQNQQLIESSMPLKSNVIEENIKRDRLKDISKSKDDLVLRLGTISQKIDILLNEEKLKQKNYRHNLTEIVEDNSYDSEKFIKHLPEMQKNEKNIRKKYKKDLQKSISKKINLLDEKEKNIKELKKSLFNEARKKEKELFLKRKNEINKKLEKTKKFINEKLQKTEKDYLYYKYQDSFDKKEKKLIEKINMIKKDPLVTQEELKELSERIEQQKQYLQGNAEERKKEMQKIWNYRSQTLPTYRHPLADKIEEENIKKLNDKEYEKRKKECNQLDKINYQPPSVKVNNKLRLIREKRINPNSKEMVLETEMNNKKRINIFRFNPINSNKNRVIKDEKSIELNNNNFIDLSEIKKSFVLKKTNKLKPIQILHPRPEKPIDYLKEIKEKRNMSTETEGKNIVNFDDLFTEDKRNENIFETIEVAKMRTNSIDRKVERKKEIMKSNGGYLKNPYLASEIGDLLLESIRAKLTIMNKLGGEKEEE